MAYLDTMAAFRNGAEPLSAMPAGAPAPAAATGEGLSPLEWQVVGIAAGDRPSSLKPAGGIGGAIAAVLGWRRTLPLANERLEALRRIALLSWRRGYSVDPGEVRRFLSAGFSADQYELVVDHIGSARAARGNRRLYA